jgi:hypothetical protein
MKNVNLGNELRTSRIQGRYANNYVITSDDLGRQQIIKILCASKLVLFHGAQLSIQLSEI